MSDNLQEQVEQELARIGELELGEQPEGYAQLRARLEAELEVKTL